MRIPHFDGHRARLLGRIVISAGENGIANENHIFDSDAKRLMEFPDLQRQTLRVVESIEQTKTGLRFKAPKTEKARAVTLPAFAVEELRRLKGQQAEELLMLGIRQTGQTLVCGRADGNPLQPHP